MNNNEEKMNFYEKGDTVYLEIKITDVKKSFDFIGKSILRKVNLSDEFGFEIEALVPSEEKFNKCISNEIKEEIVKNLQNAVDKISELLY